MSEKVLSKIINSLEMNRIEISVIIPIYNAEHFLEKTLDCIIEQTFNNYEIILVDDGSSDKSGKICDSYAIQNKNITVLHQENQGVSCARNNGLKKAVGDFIVFMDSDDLANPNYLKSLYDSITKHNVDLVIQNISGLAPFIKKDELITSKTKIWEYVESNKLYNYGFPFAKIYKKALVLRFNLHFNPSVHYSEDLFFLLKYLLYSNTLYVSTDSNYDYLQHSGSLINKYHKFETELAGVVEFKNILHNVQTELQIDNKVIPNLTSWYCYFIFRSLLSLYKYKLPQQTRIAETRKITESNPLFIQYFRPFNLQQKIWFKLLRIKQYHMADLILTIQK